ncbi:MAG: hypothetical protein Solivirus2_27 [Solivirus sp.]|uniref:F-box domain-containing protein n=1 Tax=Solivirus sp. TaxID=2487772 RepID=A0A3G5AFG6_9VIRU|nr:MAG: hypothetical protein Solivirus2_27 [Solivirus sp.]
MTVDEGRVWGPHYDALLGNDLVTRTILHYADNNTLGRLFQLNRFLRELSEENSFWRNRLIIDYGKSQMNDLGHYRLTYIINFMLKSVIMLRSVIFGNGLTDLNNSIEKSKRRLSRFVYNYILKYEFSDNMIRATVYYIRKITTLFGFKYILISLAKGGREKIALELVTDKRNLIPYISRSAIQEIAEKDLIEYLLSGGDRGTPASYIESDCKYCHGDDVLLYLETACKNLLPYQPLAILISNGFYKQAKYFLETYIPNYKIGELYFKINPFFNYYDGMVIKEFVQFCIFAGIEISYNDFLGGISYFDVASAHLLENMKAIYPTKEYCEKFCKSPCIEIIRSIAIRHGVELD